MNIPLLLKVRDRILAEPEHFDIESWAEDSECGTTACIAGHAYMLATGTDFRRLLARLEDENFVDAFPSQAASLLGLDYGRGIGKSGILFHSVWWPDQFAKPYREAETAGARAQIAADRIDHFIATEGRE